MRKFILGDCMDPDIGLPSYPDKFFDLAIVDPPYGIGVNKMRLGNGKKTIYRGVNNWDSSTPNADYFSVLFRVSKNQIIWGANNMVNYLRPTTAWIFWDKKTGMNDYSDGELAWTSFSGALRKCTKGWVGNNAKDNGNRIHPTQKPVKLYQWLLENYATPGDLILDTHVGSASSLIACESMGFNYVGYEIDPDYYAAAKNRMSKGIQSVLL